MLRYRSRVTELPLSDQDNDLRLVYTSLPDTHVEACGIQAAPLAFPLKRGRLVTWQLDGFHSISPCRYSLDKCGLLIRLGAIDLLPNPRNTDLLTYPTLILLASHSRPTRNIPARRLKVENCLPER